MSQDLTRTLTKCTRSHIAFSVLFPASPPLYVVTWTYLLSSLLRLDKCFCNIYSALFFIVINHIMRKYFTTCIWHVIIIIIRPTWFNIGSLLDFVLMWQVIRGLQHIWKSYHGPDMEPEWTQTLCFYSGLMLCCI